MQEPKFISEAQLFLERLAVSLDRHNVQLDLNWDVDHICYRVESVRLYENLKVDFLQFAELLVESNVNGRPISTYKLNRPIMLRNRRIDIIELPAPKPGKATPTGFEHIEVVCDVPLRELEVRFGHLQLGRSGLNKVFNQELELCLGLENIKFHHLSLESVVRLETNTPVWNAIHNCKVLDHLHLYDPLVAGTYPLGLQTKNSDVDILVRAPNLDEFEANARALFAGLSQFCTNRVEFDGIKTSIVTFVCNGIPFEICAQDCDSVKQRRYRHFLIEERLLKYRGHDLRKRIMDLRELGMKTEPAFACALGLEGDPYSELLKVEI